MALTNQPYLPLYVDDWMNNTKLKMCSPAAHGVMISIMSIMHKESTYGKILLKQKFKQTDKQIQNFALQVAKVSAFDFAEIENPLTELISEGVLLIDGDYLICKRMVRDAEISEKRSNAGFKGGASNKNKNFAYTKGEAKQEAKPLTNYQANSEANTVIENGVEIVNENESIIENGVETGKAKKAKVQTQKIEIIYPFFTENFKVQWQLWKTYKSKEHNFKYKSELSEQASLNELSNLSGGNETIAIAIMNQSMTKGWKGFFELKNNNQNGNGNNNSGFKTASEDYARKLAEGLQS
jgi:hypothetical protein